MTENPPFAHRRAADRAPLADGRPAAVARTLFAPGRNGLATALAVVVLNGIVMAGIR